MQNGYMYGIHSSNKDFTKAASYGKNIFTNSFPVALILYMDSKGINPDYFYVNSEAKYEVCDKPLSTLIGCSPDNARWDFEHIFDGYRPYTKASPNRSDIVVTDLQKKAHVRAIENKLVVSPNSGTAGLPRKNQCSEIVLRPSTIEQLCFSIADSYGLQRRSDLNDIIVDSIKNPMYFNWDDVSYVMSHRKEVREVVENIIANGCDSQVPLVLSAIWTTEGTSNTLAKHAFDAFFISNMALLKMLMPSADEDRMTREYRSIVWFVKALFDYSAQKSIDFIRTKKLAYGLQTDKARSFGNWNFDGAPNYIVPRIAADAVDEIVLPQGQAMLDNERRLDTAIIIRNLSK